MFSKVKIFELPNFQRALLKDLRNVWEQQSVWWPLHCWAQKVSCTSKYYFSLCHSSWNPGMSLTLRMSDLSLSLSRAMPRRWRFGKIKELFKLFLYWISHQHISWNHIIIFLGHMCQTPRKSFYIQVSSNIFLSLHTVGTSYKHWVTFNQQEDMKEVMLMILVNILTISLSIKVVNRAVFLHVALPGQRPGAPDLESFPRWNIIFVTLSWTPVMS